MTKVWEIGIDLSLHSVTCTTDYIDSQDYMYLLYNTMLSWWTLFFITNLTTMQLHLTHKI